MPLVRQRDAAKFLGISVPRFIHRKYEHVVLHGIKLYDTEKLEFIRKERSDKGKKRGANKPTAIL